MALDHKTLQAMAASQPTNVTAFCPECGRPWIAPSPERPRLAAPFPWRAAFLVAVGLSLAIACGQRVVSASQAEAATQRDLAMLSNCVDTRWTGVGCPSTSLSALHANRDDTARGQRDRALVATAVGLLALVVGVGRMAQPPQAGPPRRARSAVAAIWGLAEALLALACLLVLALYLDLVAVKLSLGYPLTGETLDGATDGVLVPLSLVTGR